MLDETALRTGCLNAFGTAGTRSDIDPAVLFQRLLLLIYAYGTNAGIAAVAAGEHGHADDGRPEPGPARRERPVPGMPGWPGGMRAVDSGGRVPVREGWGACGGAASGC